MSNVCDRVEHNISAETVGLAVVEALLDLEHEVDEIKSCLRAERVLHVSEQLTEAKSHRK